MNLLKKGIGIVGSTTIDKIIAEGHSFLKLGGVTTYAGITYHRHGIPAFIVSNMAEQDREILKLRNSWLLWETEADSSKSRMVKHFITTQQ
jgi:single-stranded DNA-specific DHH superfamily exonuclease